MKKITAIALLSIALVACKKETKIITKIDPTTGDTIKMEIPLEDSAKVAKELAEKAAIKDSAGVYKQSLKLEKGKTYPFTTYQKNNVSLNASTGEKKSAISESQDDVTFTVNDIQNNVYDITINFVAKRTSQTVDGKNYVVDTKQPAPKEEELKNKWNLDKALVGNKLNMKMDTNGKIISITGFEPVYTRISTTIAKLTKDANVRKGFQEEAKASFNEEILRDQFTKNMKIMPEKGVKIGEKWTKTENASQDGKIKLATNYTLKSVKDGVAEITLSGGIPLQSNKATTQGVTQTLSSELTQNGSLKPDVNSGWIINQNISVKTTQKESYSDGKQSQTMTNITNSSIIVNPNK